MDSTIGGASANSQPPASIADQPPLKQMRTASFDPFAAAQFSAFQQAPNGGNPYTNGDSMWPNPNLSMYQTPSPPHQPFGANGAPTYMHMQPYGQPMNPFAASSMPMPMPMSPFGHFPSSMSPYQPMSDPTGMRFLQSPGLSGGGKGLPPMSMPMQPSDFMATMMPMGLMAPANSGHQSGNTMNFSCHQCHTTYDELSLMFCTTQPHGARKRRCRKKYCHSCLSRYYDCKLQTLLSNPSTVNCWQCPACLNKCSCVRCRKEREWLEGTQNGSIQTSIVSKTAAAAASASANAAQQQQQQQPTASDKQMETESTAAAEKKAAAKEAREESKMQAEVRKEKQQEQQQQQQQQQQQLRDSTIGLLAAAATDVAATAAALASSSAQSMVVDTLPALEATATQSVAQPSSATPPIAVRGLKDQEEAKEGGQAQVQKPTPMDAALSPSSSSSSSSAASSQPMVHPTSTGYQQLHLPSAYPPSLLYSGAPLPPSLVQSMSSGSLHSLSSSLPPPVLLPTVHQVHLEPTDRCVYILRGLPGAGKSTVCAQLLAQAAMRPTRTRPTNGAPNTLVCSADFFFLDPTTNRYEFDATKLPEAHAYCLTMFLQALGAGVGCVVVDNTNTTLWEYRNYQLAAVLLGYRCVVLEIVCESEAIARRMHARHTHHVSWAHQLAMLQQFEPDATTRKLLPVFAPTLNGHAAAAAPPPSSHFAQLQHVPSASAFAPPSMPMPLVHKPYAIAAPAGGDDEASAASSALSSPV